MPALNDASPEDGRPTHGDLIAALACLWTLAGAAYFGLYACGGHAWTADAFRYGACALTLAAVACPGRWLNTWARRLLFPVLLWTTHVLVESALAPFYPAMPAGWADYARAFMAALRFGPCG